MKIKNMKAYEEWKLSNISDYSDCIFKYVERWAQMMEKEIDNGAKIEDIAEGLSLKAGRRGITPFMYSASMSILSECWEYGDELRIWRDKKYNNHEGIMQLINQFGN